MEDACFRWASIKLGVLDRGVARHISVPIERVTRAPSTVEELRNRRKYLVRKRPPPEEENFYKQVNSITTGISDAVKGAQDRLVHVIDDVGKRFQSIPRGQQLPQVKPLVPKIMPLAF